jgi:hypothetical protein
MRLASLTRILGLCGFALVAILCLMACCQPPPDDPEAQFLDEATRSWIDTSAAVQTLRARQRLVPPGSPEWDAIDQEVALALKDGGDRVKDIYARHGRRFPGPAAK